MAFRSPGSATVFSSISHRLRRGFWGGCDGPIRRGIGVDDGRRCDPVDANKETTVVTVETLDEACVIAAQPWRKLLPVHAAAELFPRMKGDELVALGEDIRRNGLRVAIVLIEVDQSAVMVQGRPVALLDGRNRLDALEATGHRINFQFYQDSVGRNYWTACGQEQIGVRIALVRPNDPHEFVLALNIRRRHLAAKQRRELISKLLRLTPEASDRQIAARANADHKTVAQIRVAQEGTGGIPQLSKRTGRDGRVRTTVSKLMRKSRQTGRIRAALKAFRALSAEEKIRFHAIVQTDSVLRESTTAVQLAGNRAGARIALRKDGIV